MGGNSAGVGAGATAVAEAEVEVMTGGLAEGLGEEVEGPASALVSVLGSADGPFVTGDADRGASFGGAGDDPASVDGSDMVVCVRMHRTRMRDEEDDM